MDPRRRGYQQPAQQGQYPPQQGYGSHPTNTYTGYSHPSDPRLARPPPSRPPFPPNGQSFQGYNADPRDPQDSGSRPPDPRQFSGNYGQAPLGRSTPPSNYGTPPPPQISTPPTTVTRPPPVMPHAPVADTKPNGDETSGQVMKVRPLFCVVCASNNVGLAGFAPVSLLTHRIDQWRLIWSWSESQTRHRLMAGKRHTASFQPEQDLLSDYLVQL